MASTKEEIQNKVIRLLKNKQTKDQSIELTGSTVINDIPNIVDKDKALKDVRSELEGFYAIVFNMEPNEMGTIGDVATFVFENQDP